MMKETCPNATPKDRGYSWVILAACFLMYSLTIGTIKTFGILYTELLEYYDAGAGTTASIISICCFIQSTMGPLANTLSISYTFRRVSFIGSILMCIGFFTSAFVLNFELLFLTYSVIIGVGYGLTYVPCTTILNFYFDKHRALANGIVFAGSGIGGFALPFLYRFLIDRYGLHGALIVLSGVMLNCCVAALLFRQPLELTGATKRHTENEISEKHSLGGHKSSYPRCQSCMDSMKTLFTFRWSLFRSPAFVLVTLAYSLASAGYDSNFYIIPAIVEKRGYGKTEVAMSMSVVGIFEVVSRIFVGWFMDRKILSAQRMFVISMFISGVSALCVPFLNSLELLYGYSAIVGIFPGSLYTFLPLIIISTVGLENLPAALGLLIVFIAVGSGIAQPGLGWLEDLTGSWDASNYCVGTFVILSSLIIFSVECCLKQKDVSQTSKDEGLPREKDKMTKTENVVPVNETDPMLHDKFEMS